VAISLADKTGEVDAKLWGCLPDRLPFVAKDRVIWVKSEVLRYKDKAQLRVLEIAPHETEIDPSLFQDRSEVDPNELLLALKLELEEVKGPYLRALIDRILMDQAIIQDFLEAPASKGLHHSYLGGLIEHTLSVVRLARLVLQNYPYLDKDILLVSAFLHDLGKIKELRWRPFHIDYTDEGRLIGHLVLGAELVDQKMDQIEGFPPGLKATIKHIILSHHGALEFGSPKRPKTLEAVCLNLLDDLDAKLNGIKRFMEKDQQPGNWTEYHRLLNRFFLKGPILGDGEPLDGSGQDLNGEGI
jgi:3'-5' exoribonuclease